MVSGLLIGKTKSWLDVSYSDLEEKYGAPYYCLHRADLLNLLVDTARSRENITLITGCKVVEYDFERPAVKLQHGEWLSGDLVVCCDGIKSAVREVITGAPIEPMDTGDVAYRILVDAKPVLEDPQTRHLVTDPWATHWIGPEAHAVGYPLRGGELYNIIIDTTHTTDCGQPVGQDEWRSQANNNELVERFKDWCYPVRKICSLTGQYLKWKLADFDQLQRWVHPSNKVVLLGDACHPMMPYMAQGAAQATEDAATLAASLAHFDNLPEALETYQRQRLPRAANIMRNTRVRQQWWHLYDGPARAQRDESMRHDSTSNPMFWGHSARMDWLFGHDARNLNLRNGAIEVPDLPPMPPEEASVYSLSQRRGFEDQRPAHGL